MKVTKIRVVCVECGLLQYAEEYFIQVCKECSGRLIKVKEKTVNIALQEVSK